MLAKCLVAASGLLAALAFPPGVIAQSAARQERDAAAKPGQLSEVGKGEHMARQATQQGAYITPRHRKAVETSLVKFNGPGKPCLPGYVRSGDACKAPDAGAAWSIGDALPRNAHLQSVPASLLSALPKAPPGNRYVLFAGDILLIAAESRMVVDAVPLARK